MNISTSFERITPAQAQKYLEHNTINRNLRMRHVEKLASDIAEGRWLMNGASIVFNGDGTLIDGQHRLSAIVKSGVSVDVLVVRGVSKSAMATVDANISRSAADVAKLRGYTNSNNLIAAARLFYGCKTGTIIDIERVSSSASMEILLAHPHLQDSVNWAVKFQKTLPIVPIAVWHYLTFYIGGAADDVTAGMRVLETGIPHYAGDAMHVFRERCIKDRHLMTGNSTNRLNGLWTLASAWNDFRRREPRSMIRIASSEVKFGGVDYGKL